MWLVARLVWAAGAVRLSRSRPRWRSSRASDVSPYLGAVVDLTPEVAAYASHTDIFTPQYQLDQSGKALDPVTGRSSEAGKMKVAVSSPAAARLTS